jgi:two-component system chemotaxis response regulator CheY
MVDQSAVVLIVDDDESIRETLALALQLGHHEAAAVSNGREALDWLEQHRLPRLILVDLMMPVMDGWQLLERLRQDDRLSRVPVVVITAFGRDLGSAGQYPILRKPIEFDDLLETVGRYRETGSG